MTDNIPALIEEARAFIDRRGVRRDTDLIVRLADALEAVTKSRSNVLLLNTHITNALNNAGAERDRYRAAVQEASDHEHSCFGESDTWRMLTRALNEGEPND